MEYIEKLLNKMAQEDNTIDLNAYALGIQDSKAPEMLEMLKVIINDFEEDGLFIVSYESIDKAKQLIKEATEL